MKTNYVLIDYENVQPTDFALLREGSFKLKLFLGANQSKIPVAVAASIHGLGGNAEYVSLDSCGSNALDFHIAYYIGALAAHEPSAVYHVISKDTGFDPLIRHLRTKGIQAHRSASIGAIPAFKRAPPPPTGDAQIDAIVAHLGKMKAARPRTRKTLLSTLHALFKKELSEHQLSSLFAALHRRGIVKLEGDKVSYELPPA